MNASTTRRPWNERGIDQFIVTTMCALVLTLAAYLAFPPLSMIVGGLALVAVASEAFRIWFDLGIRDSSGEIRAYRYGKLGLYGSLHLYVFVFAFGIRNQAPPLVSFTSLAGLLTMNFIVMVYLLEKRSTLAND